MLACQYHGDRLEDYVIGFERASQHLLGISIKQKPFRFSGDDEIKRRMHHE